MEQLYRQGIYEFRPFSEEVTALRLGARRRSTVLCAYDLQGCEPFTLRRGVAYIEFTGPLPPSVMKGLRYIKSGALLVTPHIKCHHGHKGYLITDRLDTEWLLIS